MKTPRFRVVAIPGSGDEASWFVWDSRRNTYSCELPSREAAMSECRSANAGGHVGVLLYTIDDDGVWLRFECGREVSLGFDCTPDAAVASFNQHKKEAGYGQV